MKGCYVYCCDKPLADYLAAQLEPQCESAPGIRIEPEVNDEVKYIDFSALIFNTGSMWSFWRGRIG